MSLPILKLKPKEDKRLRQGHLWIYSNEVDTKATPLKSFSAGQQVLLKSTLQLIIVFQIFMIINFPQILQILKKWWIRFEMPKK